MKYGEKLRQRSIPAWSAYNIDYDDVKQFIKKNTTPRQDNATTSIPNLTEERLRHLEDGLFDIFDEQHRRIDLFVKSKAREIQHRLSDSKRRLRNLTARNRSLDSRLSVARLEKYSRLESEVLKAGEEIRSLARFTGAQRIAFGKLLKKYKKWTGSPLLEDRFREQVLNDPKSFVNLDLGALLDDYSETLHSIRALYESRLQQTAALTNSSDPAASFRNASSIIQQLHDGLESRRNTAFDTTISTVPVGESSIYATYFVHPENLVELQVILVQHLAYFAARSRVNSLSTPVSSRAEADTSPISPIEQADHFCVGADNLARFAEQQSVLSDAERESRAGLVPQMLKICARWNTNDDSDAVVATKMGETFVQVGSLRKKDVQNFFAKANPMPARNASDAQASGTQSLDQVRSPLMRDANLEPLCVTSCNRSRFVGIHNSSTCINLATLDTAISFQPFADPAGSSDKATFPFAVLVIRQEGLAYSDLISHLNQSHLVERVQGFSLEHHAIWQLYEPESLPAPTWASTLSLDIRKLPPPALHHSDTSMTEHTSGSTSAPSGSTAAASLLGGGVGGSTAVNTNASSSMIASDFEQAPSRITRKKRARIYSEPPIEQTQRYWSEYDHPEDGGDNDNDAYVIYIDPNEKSTLDRVVEILASWFPSRMRASDEESLLHTPVTPREDESSSEEEGVVSPRSRKRKSYGTLTQDTILTQSRRQHTNPPLMPQLTVACLTASAVILIIGYLLATTGRHRQGGAVHAGVVFAVVSSVLFAIAGVILLFRAKAVHHVGSAMAVCGVFIEAVAAGGLLALLLR